MERRWIIRALMALLPVVGAPYAVATEGPFTPAEAMDWCCAPLFGEWRGKGWWTLADGRKADFDAEIQVIRSADGGSARFIMDYAPLKAGEGAAIHKIALLTYTVGPSNGKPYSTYTFRYLWGGPYWGVRDFWPSPFVPTEWTEPAPGGGIIRYISSNTETEWTLAGFCCSGEDEDRLSTYILVTRVGPLGKPSIWTPVPCTVPRCAGYD